MITVFADCETTSLRPVRDDAAPERLAHDVAMIRRDEDGNERDLQFFIDIDLSRADPYSLQVGKFYQRHPMGLYLSGQTSYRPRPTRMTETTITLGGRVPVVGDGELVDEALAAHLIARWTHEAVIVGSKPAFEDETWAPLLRRFGLIPGWDPRPGDIRWTMIGYLAGLHAHGHSDLICDERRLPCAGLPDGDLRKVKTDDLSRILGVEPPADNDLVAGRHTALGDARWSRDVYDAMFGRSVQAPANRIFHAFEDGGEGRCGFRWMAGPKVGMVCAEPASEHFGAREEARR